MHITLQSQQAVSGALMSPLGNENMKRQYTRRSAHEVCSGTSSSSNAKTGCGPGQWLLLLLRSVLVLVYHHHW